MNKRERKQLESVKAEYPNPSVTNDVIKTEYEAYPGHLEETRQEDDRLDDFEESIVEHTTDGKTWNSDDDE